MSNPQGKISNNKLSCTSTTKGKVSSASKRLCLVKWSWKMRDPSLSLQRQQQFIQFANNLGLRYVTCNIKGAILGGQQYNTKTGLVIGRYVLVFCK